MSTTKDFKINRTYKDRLFRFIFHNKEDLLELYSAIHNTDYKDASQLVITTLEDAIYIGMKNDLSFLIKGILNLYGHQGTYNPNLPLRGLLYLADEYSIQNDILSDFLRKNRAEVFDLLLTEYDEVKHVEMERQDKGKSPDSIAYELDEDLEYINQIIQAINKIPIFDLQSVYDQLHL